MISVLAVAFMLPFPRMAKLSPAHVFPSTQSFHWRLVGPFRGGRALAVTGVPSHPNRFYFGAVDGGVWRSDNAGRTWNPIFDGVPVGSIGAVAVAPSDPNIVYVGTGEADMRSDIGLGSGMYRSDDGGNHWSAIGLADTQAIGKVVVDPSDPNVVYVAALGHPYASNTERGIFKSTDGGKTWTKSLYIGPSTGAIDLAQDPSQPSTLYASMWRTRRTPWSVYPPSNGEGSGLFKTTDGGGHWVNISTNGLPELPGRIGVAVSQSQPETVYALVDAAKGGLYRSDDGGATWRLASADPRIWGRGWYFGGVTVSPTDPNDVYICNTAVYESKNGGKTFVPIKGAPGGDDYHTLWIDPTDASHRILGSDQGVVVSVDGGTTWSSWYNQPTAQIYHVATDNAFPYRIYGAQQDSGAMRIPSRTESTDGISLRDFYEVTVGGESGMIAPDPLDPHIVYGGGVEKLNLTTEETVGVSPTVQYPGIYRSAWTLPLVFSTADPRRMFYANQKVFTTADGGAIWKLISPDLTQKSPAIPPNLDDVTAADSPERGPQRGVVYTLAPSPTRSNVLWAGTDDGLVWKTTDLGAHWENVTPDGLEAWSKVGSIAISTKSDDDVVIGIDRHRLDDLKPYIEVTHDGGKSWEMKTRGIPDGDFINSVCIDPVNPKLMFAGAERGVFVSFDGADHWQPLGSGLPTTSVRDVIEKDGDLVIATLGRGVYILDDMVALREFPLPKALHLFKPQPAYILHAAGFTGSPMPKSEPRGENPPSGAIFDYFLPGKVDSVRITVTQASKVIAHFLSGPPQPGPDVSKIDIAPIWIHPGSALQTTPGMHRVTWNLHDENGLWVVPGRYLVTLTVNGVSSQQVLTVLGDPRARTPMSAYEAQYRLAVTLSQENAKVSKVIQKVTALMMGPATPSPVVEQLKRFVDLPAKADPRNSVGTPLTDSNTLNFVEGELQGLLGEVEAGSAAPVRGVVVAAAEAVTNAETLLNEVKPILAKAG